jgi:aminopeptidase N
MKSLLLPLLCASALADNYPRQPGIDIQHYLFRVTLNDSNDEIVGETTVVVKFVKDGVGEVALDLASPMSVTEVSPGVRFDRPANRLVLALGDAPKSGDTRSFTVKYHGVPADGLKIGKNKYGDRCFFSQNWPDLARQWLPTVDHPYDKATSEFVITAPARYQVVANGLPIEEIDLADGRRTTHWKQSVPIATWLNNIGVCQFASRTFGKAAGVPLEDWVFPQDREAGIGTFDVPMRQAIQFYNDHIGPYPYEKLAAVQNGAANGGGMEHASEIFYGQNTVTGKPASGLVAHEIAHQWFGDSVTEKDWDDVWLSEGFATYFAALTAEFYEGRTAFANTMQRSRTAVFAAEKRLQGVAVVQTKEWKGIPNGIVYQKGGWSLHMLRALIGTDKFWAGIREYYRTYRDGNASTADFRKVMEQASGADLGWFFDQWIYRPGSPAVEGTWAYDPGSKKVGIELAQTQAGEVYRLPIEVSVGGSVQKIEMTQKRQRFELAAAAEPGSVELDPNTWLLMDAKFSKR